ncbi:unnamed protein product [Rotaria socialis]|uniref:Uncharacterized protein n=1 Tax=Rotaria socialis TaxID=392032 RepID=A0A820GEJ9_9BILA|nr:unnamed protein product [Rotaria socialis]CAF3664521.1 unnamed protein product [Rotaria socialis]CAF4275833.1 unnamed protein product [Rotaria socialis]CAF4462355.1 unnamed protein product [Rotaria socialis]
MAAIVAEIFGRVFIELVGAVISSAIQSSVRQRGSNHSTSSSQKQDRSLPQLSSSSNQNGRAVLTASCNIIFGNDCERLVNIAFETSQTFPTLMGTYADVIQYLRKELAKQHPDQQFHIIIGQNEKFGFSVEEDEYYAEIEQDRYRVLIFTTKQNPQIKSDIHDANSKMQFVWN